jgi:putative SOS response-associated peptidase YedK
MKDTFSIITTDANPMMEFIHNSKKRMPLIIRQDDIAAWIDPEMNAETVVHLMKPYDELQMSAHTISKDASYASKNRNYPEIKDEVVYNETRQGDLFG